MSEYKLKCNKCDFEQSVDIDDSVPFFNQARKHDWAKLTCQNCGVPLLAAKFSKKSNILFAMVGHTTYLDMYDRKDDEEKLELYLKVESELKIFK